MDWHEVWRAPHGHQFTIQINVGCLNRKKAKVGICPNTLEWRLSIVSRFPFISFEKGLHHDETPIPKATSTNYYDVLDDHEIYQTCARSTESSKDRTFWIDEEVWIEMEWNRLRLAWRNKLRVSFHRKEDALVTYVATELEKIKEAQTSKEEESSTLWSKAQSWIQTKTIKWGNLRGSSIVIIEKSYVS